MAGMQYVLDLTEQPDGAVNIYRAVVFTATGVAQASGLGALTVEGIAQEEVSAGDATARRQIAVRVHGISRAVAGAALNRGDSVRTDATGKMVGLAATTPNQRQVGICMEAAANNDTFNLLLTPGEFRDVP
jgi:hypothetical protein